MARKDILTPGDTVDVGKGRPVSSKSIKLSPSGMGDINAGGKASARQSMKAPVAHRRTGSVPTPTAGKKPLQASSKRVKG